MKAAVIGLGWWGRHIVTTLKDSDEIDVTTVAARSRDKHQTFADEAGVTLLSSYEEVLSDPGVDAVILCTPHSQHEDQALAAIAAGKQLFCEKPLALNTASVKKIVAAAEARDMIIGIGHERRYESSMEEISKRVSSGTFGVHMHAEANFSHNLLASTDAGNWRGSQEEAPAAGMTGMGIHLTDLFLWMFGSVERLCAQTAKRVLDLPTGDLVAVQFQFKSGATAFVTAISATPYYGRFSVFGDQKWIEARDTAHPQHGGEVHLVSCDVSGEQVAETLPPRNAVKANLEEWARAVSGRGAYRFTNAQLVENVAILEAISKSVQTKAWVDVSV